MVIYSKGKDLIDSLNKTTLMNIAIYAFEIYHMAERRGHCREERRCQCKKPFKTALP